MAVLRIAILGLAAALADPASAAAVLGPRPACARIVTLDAGHTPRAAGAVSASGKAEYGFNRRLADELAQRLAEAGWTVRFLVKPGEEIALHARAARVAALSQGVMLSIHHDSVQPRFLVHPADGHYSGPVSFHGSGFSLLVRTGGPAARESLSLARAIGERLLLIPLKPSTHHAEKIAGEGHAFIDPRLGIYQYNGLAVLRSSRIPAVLIEAAVIVNPLDELWAAGKANRRAFTAAVLAGLEDICSRPAAAEPETAIAPPQPRAPPVLLPAPSQAVR